MKQHTCTIYVLHLQPCDLDFQKKIRLEGPGIPMPKCYKTDADLPPLRVGESDFGVIGPANMISTVMSTELSIDV